ncbi:MAG TPA: nuclear transport factor 2 family protein, partial [Opitutales bacterium]|nr:nuclear transport factor 2 family protein [Opitutales bacterium]
MKYLLKSCLMGALLTCALNVFAQGGAAGGGGVDSGLLTGPETMPGDTAETEAKAVCKAFDKAFASNDTDALSRLIADGATHVNPMGTALSKEAFLQDIKAGKVRFSAYNTQSLDIVERVGLTLVLGGVLQASAVREGVTVTGQFRFVRILVASAEMRWQEVYSQM